MMSFASIGIVSIMWVLIGFSLTFGSTKGRLVGNPGDYDFLNGLGLDKVGTFDFTGNVPDAVFVGFQMMFAIITVALISGAIADRAKFGGWVLFSILWITIVYFPVAHWVFNFGSLAGEGDTVAGGAAYLFKAGTGGWIVNKLGAVDLAGGTAVHINAGAAALALVFVLGKRRGFGTQAFKPHNVPFVMLGAALLWFGWFGFNAGSVLAANANTGLAFLATQVATATAALAWIGVERLRDGHATGVGFASGAVAGLVAITPACGSVNPMGAMAVGAIAGGACCLAVGMKSRFGFDDSLDVVGVHLVGGIVGTLSIGLFATNDIIGAPVGAEVNGLFFGGGLTQLGKQAIAAGAVLAYSFVLTFIIGTIVDKTIGFRISEEDEVTGIDLTTHGESAYEFTTFGGGTSLVGAGHGAPGSPGAGAGPGAAPGAAKVEV